MEMKSPKYPAYPSFVPYGGFYSSYMPMAYKSENMVHYPYAALRSPPTPSGSSDSNFSPMSLTSPTHFSTLHSPLSRHTPVHSPHTPSGSHSYFSNAAATAAVLAPLTPPVSSSSSPSPSPYHHHTNNHHQQQHQHHHHSYFSADCLTTPNTQGGAIVGGGVSLATPNSALQQLHFTATATEWPRPLP